MFCWWSINPIHALIGLFKFLFFFTLNRIVMLYFFQAKKNSSDLLVTDPLTVITIHATTDPIASSEFLGSVVPRMVRTVGR